jgi:hypothetical protein
MKFELLIGKRILGTASSRDYIQWAESLLLQNVGSENVAILAGLACENNSDSEEVEKYFQRSLEDLGLVLPNEEEALKNYAKVICEQIVSGDLEPEKGFSILARLDFIADHKIVLFSIWDSLSEDLQVIGHHEKFIVNTGLTKDNKKEYIKKVAVQFIELVETDLPENFFHLHICSSCGHNAQGYKSICDNCKKSSLYSMSDYEGRKLYFSKKAS